MNSRKLLAIIITCAFAFVLVINLWASTRPQIYGLDLTGYEVGYVRVWGGSRRHRSKEMSIRDISLLKGKAQIRVKNLPQGEWPITKDQLRQLRGETYVDMFVDMREGSKEY